MLPRVIATAKYSSNAAFSVAGAALAIVGPANAGAVNVPTPLTQPSQAETLFGGGPLVTSAAKAIATKRIPVLAIRTAATQASQFSAVSRTTGHGASVVTVDAGSDTTINASVLVQVVTGGTVGVPGITYKVSTDGGRTFSASPIALGTATAIDVTLGDGTLTLNATAAALVTGEVISVTASVLAAGSHDTLDRTNYPLGTNTASASVTAGTYPDNDYQIVVEFTKGGALGTAGIEYRYSTANGRAGTWSPTRALGTALAIVIPGTGGFGLTLGDSAETIGTGASLYVRTFAPSSSLGAIQAALTALFLNKTSWEDVYICGALDAAMILGIDAIFAAAYSVTPNGEKYWIGNADVPDDGETEAAYLARMGTLSDAARSCYFGSVCAGDAKYTDALTGYLHKRPVALLVAIEQASVTPNIDVARVDRPGLPAMLADDNGNPDCHDESNDPGLDDLGFVTLRTMPEGVYVTNPRIFSPAGTNVEMVPHRKCLNLHTRVAKNYFRKVLSNDLFADTATGYLLESEAARLEKGVNDAENDTLRTPGWISGQEVTISRTDQLIGVATPTITVSGQLQPKAYPKLINYTDQLVVKIGNA